MGSLVFKIFNIQLILKYICKYKFKGLQKIYKNNDLYFF